MKQNPQPFINCQFKTLEIYSRRKTKTKKQFEGIESLGNQK